MLSEFYSEKKLAKSAFVLILWPLPPKAAEIILIPNESQESLKVGGPRCLTPKPTFLDGSDKIAIKLKLVGGQKFIHCCLVNSENQKA